MLVFDMRSLSATALDDRPPDFAPLSAAAAARLVVELEWSVLRLMMFLFTPKAVPARLALSTT